MPYVNDTGFPSVTDIISRFINTDWFTEESRERGSAVHDACFAHIKGGYVVPLRPSWSGYFDSFRRWVDMVKPSVFLAEKRLVDNDLKFCGQPDFAGLVAEIRAGAGLIDWKTSIAFEKWFRLQGAAYRHLAKIDGIKTQWGGNLRLRADGALPLFDYWPDDPLVDFNYFLSALNCYRFFENGGSS